MTPRTARLDKNLIPALHAFFKLGVSREVGMRLLMTRELNGELVGKRWYVDAKSLERRIAVDRND